MSSITLKDDGVELALARAVERLGDLTPVMQEIGEMLTISTKDRVRKGLQPGGAAFAPRSASTLRAYERRQVRPKGGPLNLTGDLIAGIFPQAGPDYAEVGSSAVQSAVMQFGQPKGASGTTSRGGPIPWGDIPARPFLGLSDDDRIGIGEIVGEALGRALVGG